MDTPLNISTASGGSALVPSMGTGSSMVTLPSIPNPAPPPPKKLTVVTPDAAKTDLAGKQSTTSAVSQALAQQTSNNLQNAFGQPINTAPGSPVPTQPGQQQPGQQNTAQGAQQQPQSTQSAQGSAGAIQQPTGTGTAAPTTNAPGVSQVTLPNGVKANYDSNTGQLTTVDGKQLTWDKSQNAWVDPATLQPPTPAGTTDASGTLQTPSTGDPVSDYIISSLAANQAQADKNAADFQSSLSKILNGTMPLTADQQAQVTAIQSSFDQLKQTQQQANDNYVSATKLLGIREGREQYQPGIFAEDVKDAISDGVSKIAALDTQASGAVADLRKGFMDDDYTIINASYTALQNALTQKSDTLNKMQTAVDDAVNVQTQRLQQQKTQLDLQTTTVTNAAQAVLGQALKADGTLDLDVIQQAADDYGVDANTLYGAVQKAQRDEITFQQGESKFATDQIQAAAQLKATNASTAEAYANIAKTNAETAALKPIDVSSLPADAQPLIPAFNSASTGLTAAQTTQAKQTFNQLVNSGDYQGAKDYIVRVAASSLPTAQQTQVIGRSEAINSLSQIQSLLDQAKSTNNGTGLVKGSLINIGTKLGQSDDPDLQYIGSRIQQELQVYRRAMTGVAFSPQESAQYEKIFPDITNVDELNTTKIQALTDGLNNNNRTDLSFAIGGKNYDSIFGADTASLPSQTVKGGSTVSYGGKQYSVDADGTMTELK